MTSRAQSVGNADRDLQMFLVRIAGTLGELLGDDLVGLYVHGALASGEFRRDQSVIDVVAVVARKLSQAARDNVARTLARLSEASPTPGALDVLVIEERHARAYSHPLPVELRHGPERDARGIASRVADARERGVVLVGPPANRLFGAVPREHMQQ